MSRIISYRGKLADGGQDTINLHTNDGKTGYKVVKFQAISSAPAGNSPEAVIQIWKVPQTATSYNIDFNSQTLLGAIFYENSNSVVYFGGNTIIFDNEKFNQDIYITCASTDGDINYYIELEQMDLTEDQALVAIVKNLRNEQ